MTTELPADILIVDDTPANLRLLAGLLTDAGYRVRPARDGRIALTAAIADPPDLVLLDIMMPGLDGYEVCRRLKADARTRDVPVIFISALNDVHDVVRSFEVGAVDYVTKPFQAQEVLARVLNHLAIHQLQRELKGQVTELDAFAHTVAHDLKNPLAHIIGMLDFVKVQYEESLTAEVIDHLDRVQDTGQRSVRIIEELLLLASVRKQAVPSAPLDMARVVTMAQGRLGHMIHECEATISVDEAWPIAYGHAPWVEEVWVNYISNGLKYGGSSPHLHLGAVEQPKRMIRFFVRDNGPGLSPEKQAVLFTEFERLSEVRVEGYGLGLSIVQRIIDKLGGRVGVQSVVGQGSEFFFELPVSQRH